jgi:hypothetical protein
MRDAKGHSLARIISRSTNRISGILILMLILELEA